MKYLLYDILLHFFVIVLSPYFLYKMFSARKYREGIPERFGFFKKDKSESLKGGPVVWVHAVSVGETKAVLPVLRLLKERRPGVKVLFSTVTQTGNRTAATDGAGLIDALIYFPFDLSWVLKRVIKETDPKAFVVVEKEVWPNLFHRLREAGVPVIVANGTISDRSFRRFLRFSFFFRPVFAEISYFLARTEGDMKKALGCGVAENVAATSGNLKFDLKPPKVDPSYIVSLKKALGVKEEDLVLVAGSTHPGEEEIVLKAYRDSGIEGLKLVIAPRHPERFPEVESLIKKSGLDYSKRSSGGSSDIVLLDTVGELMMVYSFSTVALVCGSLVDGIGGHNLLEPAYFSKPVVYGTHLTTYLDMAEMLEKAGGGARVANGELAPTLKRLFSDEAFRDELGRNAKKVVEENRGAAAKTVEVIERFLDKRQGTDARN